jgi:hypothetical protein
MANESIPRDRELASMVYAISAEIHCHPVTIRKWLDNRSNNPITNYAICAAAKRLGFADALARYRQQLAPTG